MTSELRRLHASFADDNPLLYASLGLLSSFRSFDRLLAEHAPERSDDLSAHAQLNAEGVDFVLGLIAFRARLESHLLAAAGDPAEASKSAADPGPVFESFSR